MKKDFMSLTIKDSFMFYAVMSDTEQCRRLLSLVLDMEIEEVSVHREDTLIYHPEYHGIRLDVIAVENDTRRRFNVEMQARSEKKIGKRTRYYHSLMDADALLPNHEYDELPDTYVIFICDFDPMGQELYRYSYEMICRETGRELNDGKHTILLSTKGKDKDAVPPELVSFLEYVGNPAGEEYKQDPFVNSLDAQISAIKQNREWRKEYMLLELKLREERKEGHAEGLAEGLAEGRAEGELRTIIGQCCRKLTQGKSVVDISEALDWDLSQIEAIVNVAQKYAPDYDVDKIYEELKESIS